MYLGIDTHAQYVQVAIVDADGRLVDEVRLPTDRLGTLAEEYAGSEAVIEASGTYRPIYETLDEHLEVTLANPSKNRLIAENTAKTDRLDAKRLAHLLRSGMLAESYVPADDIQELRDLVRTRKSLVEERTAEKNRVHAVLKRTDNTYESELFGPNGRAFLAELSLSTADRTIVEAHLSVIDELTEQISAVEELIDRHVTDSTQAQRLLSIPGVGMVSAAVILAEIGDVSRFDRPEELVSYAGLDPTVHQSGGTEIHGSISKEGSAPLRWILVEVVNNTVRIDEYLGNFYTRLKRRKNHQVAIVAAARKLLVSIYFMLTRQELYDPPGVSA